VLFPFRSSPFKVLELFDNLFIEGKGSLLATLVMNLSVELSLDEPGGKKRDPSKDFTLLEKLGEGSYGSVWKALHNKSKQITAIKKIPVENDLDEIIKEIKIMKLCKSPYIISYYGSYFKDSELWIVMEFCGGGSVSDLMKITDKNLNEEQIAVVLKDALKGLDYLHELKKIHRDIKAGNILLNDKGEGKLADFGVSGQLSDTMAKRQTVIGTPFWMAPEVIQEVGYDVKADIWSLGITAIELAESKPPYANIHPMRAIFMIPSRPPPKLSEPDKWSKEFNDFVSQCLTKNPEYRPSASTLLKHPFISKAKTSAVLLSLIKEMMDIVKRVGREEALGLVTNSESEGEEEDENGNASVDNSGTVIRGGISKHDFNSSPDYSTMVVQENSSSSKGSGKEEYVPPFLQHIRNDHAAASSTPPAVKIERNPKYANYSVEELKKMLSELTLKADKEAEIIKERYAKQKKDYEQAILSKKRR